jgi:hypothetical protein
VDDMQTLFGSWWAKSGLKDYNAQEEVTLKNDFKNYKGKEDKAMLQKQVQKDTLVVQAAAAKLSASDFVFAFHPNPAASVLHLHLHIIAAPAALCVNSTAAHNQKSIL